MKRYWTVRLGPAATHAPQMVRDGYVGVDFVGSVDITPAFPMERRAALNFLASAIDRERPGQKKGTVRAHAGNLLNLAQGISIGDVVVAPLRDGAFALGTVTDPYEFHPGTALPHRRRVEFHRNINREDMSDALKSPMRAIGTLFNLDEHGAELDSLIEGGADLTLSDSEVVFGMEKQLEDFLVHNWKQTSLAQDYDIFEVDRQPAGQQYPTDTGPIDILAQSKDGSHLLVIELKRGRISDIVVGQIQRYMGYVLDEVCEPGQEVQGLVIALEDDVRLRRALRVAPTIRFAKYRISFALDDVATGEA